MTLRSSTVHKNRYELASPSGLPAWDCEEQQCHQTGENQAAHQAIRGMQNRSANHARQQQQKTKHHGRTPVIMNVRNRFEIRYHRLGIFAAQFTAFQSEKMADLSRCTIPYKCADFHDDALTRSERGTLPVFRRNLIIRLRTSCRTRCHRTSRIQMYRRARALSPPRRECVAGCW
jgi:hypothetical protein